MRTRFPNNDYFTLPPSQRHETLHFPHLRVPRLPQPPPSADSFLIDPLPIDAALSSFLSAVLPRRIDMDPMDLYAEVIFEDHVSYPDIEFPKENVCFTEERMQMPSPTPEVENSVENMVNRKLEKSSKVAPEADNFVPLIPAVKTEHGHQSLEPFPGSVIIFNTQNVDKEMIMHRRSSRQVILALEKGGIQVVERDLDLPVDIILSSAICLAWYDSRNLGKKATPASNSSSSFLSCIENIATDVLQVVAFCFRSCFLVFEGEFNFLSTVMESSDGLYAAAAYLEIDLQIFFSDTPDVTNEVIISCIKSTATLTTGLYPKMPDSVTLAESFLTQFPGINPLTAHCILSSGTMLNEFLAWSHEQRIHVLEHYHVPEESLSLFSVFCRYGEQEDSKSILTDCSSLISSGPHSDWCNKKEISYIVHSVQKDDLCCDELLQFETLNQEVAAVLDSSTLPKPFDLGMSKDAGRYRDLGIEVENCAKPNWGKDVFPLDFKLRENIGSTRAAIRNLGGLPFQEEMSHLSNTTLSRAQLSFHALKRSPLTTRSQVKEKKSKRNSPSKNHSLLEYFPLL